MAIFLKTVEGAKKLKLHGVKEAWLRTGIGADKLWMSGLAYLPSFTGQHTIFGDELQGRIELYSSGELTLSPYLYDAFLVGGGGGSQFYGGGGGGYTKTSKAIPLAGKHTVIIGAGGLHVNGGITSVFGQTVNGGNYGGYLYDKRYYGHGGNGGSGGGNGFENGIEVGASDGGNARTNSSAFGKGQGRTTRAFEEMTGTIFSGGGGGGYSSGSEEGGAQYPVSGGSGGGGSGCYYVCTGSASCGRPPSAGTPNTGGGAGGGEGRGGQTGTYIRSQSGGSGRATVRWGY